MVDPAPPLNESSPVIPGQRYLSTSEPDLGLGNVRSSGEGLVEINFPAAGETRKYAADSAPLLRVRFEPGDQITDRSGHHFTISHISEKNGLLTYSSNGTSIPESDLLDTLSFIRPEKRILAALTDPPRDFDLRLEALRWNAAIRSSPARGYTGARIDLIPHQLSIAAEAANRLHPRILLADEVGLGKTIEACLILHRLHITGRAGRILILVPEPLVHQWFIELLRRFNLLFALFDEDRCQSITSHDPGANPFSDSQLILCPISFLTENRLRLQQARDSGFDLLIVDEAHHLEWSPGNASAAYQAVATLASRIPSLLLLTATPNQLGPAGHFARLRLLDPARYSDLDAYLSETAKYIPLAQAVAALSDEEIPAAISSFTSASPRADKHLHALRSGDESARRPLISELVDSFGTGRVLFRNTREHLTGFPLRIPVLHPLPPGTSPYTWLAELLKSLPDREKVLLITSSPESAIKIQEKLLSEINLKSALFHEDLTLLQRDRNAAWFQEPEGARILICSEIGSEGRNFQFARHLVLFGLPRDPEVLEQRIGRLDRIGQTGDITIHIPYGKYGESALQAGWLHQALDAFSAPLKGATTLATTLLPGLDTLGKELFAADPASITPADDPMSQPAVAAFFKLSRQLKADVSASLKSGHDRLLELGAPAPALSADLMAAIMTADSDPKFERFALRLFDHLGLEVSDLFQRAFLLKHGPRQSDSLSDIPEDGLSVTFDRETALSREDLRFITIDHPVFLDALRQLLSGQSGTACFALLQGHGGKSILLECAFVLEALAPPRLHLDRYLPPTLLRVIVDHTGKSLTKAPPARLLQPADPRRIVSQPSFRTNLLPKMLAAATAIARNASKGKLGDAAARAASSLDASIARLQDLSQRNSSISQIEIAELITRKSETQSALSAARVRLDSLRLIYSP